MAYGVRLRMESHTVADLLTLYERDYLPHKAPSTQYQQRLLYRWLHEELGTIPLADLTPLVLRTWRDSLRQWYRPNTIRRYMTAFSAMLTVAVEDLEWLTRHPLRKVAKPPAAPDRERLLTHEELQRLLAECQASRNQHLYVAVVVALCTGTRKNELLQRLWTDIDLERNVLRLPHSKNGERRAIPLVPRAAEVLQAQRVQSAGSRWVFPQKNADRPVFIDYAWGKACERAGIADLHWHDMRHCCASFLAMSGADIQVIAQILGHKSLQQTMKYVHLMEPHTRAVLEAMAQKFLSCVLAALSWKWLWLEESGPQTVAQLAGVLGF